MLDKLDSSTPKKTSFRLLNHDDNKFLSKILSRESDRSPSEASFRVYYGSRSGSVPFFWESEPGTPKHALHEFNAPPLTPPPAYNYPHTASDHSATRTKLLSGSNILRFLFLLKASPNRRASRTMVGSKSSTESKMAPGKWLKFESFESVSSDSKEDDQGSATSSPTPAKCFGSRRSTSRRVRS